MSRSADVPPAAVTADPPPLPGRRVLRQRWAELAYFHWPYEPREVQALLPDGVRVDTHDGVAWVGVIPFTMRDVRIGPSPPVPWLGTFIEINVRTYVVDATGRRAVWFFSLDVPRSAIVAVARSVFALPYCWARAGHTVDGRRHRYTMRRRWPDRAPTAEIEFTVGRPLPPDRVTDLDHFLTARWGLLTTRRGRVLHGAVHHERWPLHDIDEFCIEQDIVRAAGLRDPRGPPRTLYAPGVDVGVSWLRPVGADRKETS